jgi:hypothetical protein
MKVNSRIEKRLGWWRGGTDGDVYISLESGGESARV